MKQGLGAQAKKALDQSKNPWRCIYDYGTKKEKPIFKDYKDNFGFLFILQYYNCSGLLYANR
jgi:hypothetical protein